MKTALTVDEFKRLLTAFESENSFNEAEESLEDAVLRTLAKEHPNTYFRADAQWLVKTDGTQLKVVKDEEIKLTIAATLRALVKETSKGDRKRGLATQTNIKNCYERFKDYCEVNSKFDSHPELLFFQNGIFNTDTSEFRAYREDDLSLVNLPYSYNPKATCPNDIYCFWMEKYVSLGLNEDEQLEQLQAIIRFYLDCSEESHWEHFIHIIGKQGSGKGLLCQLIAALYTSDNISNIDDLSHLTEATKAQDYLAGEKRLCLGSEIHSYIENQSGFYKLTVGESVTTRRLFHQTNDKSRYYTRFLLASTSAITTSAKANEGLGRRMIVLKTNGLQGKLITKSDGKINFKALAGEYASWALQMPRKKMEEVLLKLQATNSDEATLNYNPIALFLTECFERVNDNNRRHSTEDFVTLKDMYSYYSAWAAYSKTPSFGRNTFNNKLRETIEFLYRKEKVDRVGSKLIKTPNRFIGLNAVSNLLDTSIEPNRINPSSLLEGQTPTDLLTEIDHRESPTYSQLPISPEAPSAIAVEEDGIAF